MYHSVECPYARCHSKECHSIKCHSALCHSTDSVEFLKIAYGAFTRLRFRQQFSKLFQISFHIIGYKTHNLIAHVNNTLVF
jgi:hypothetical protein